MHNPVYILIALSILLSTGSVHAAPEIWREIPQERAQARDLGGNVSYFNADDTALRNALALIPDQSSDDVPHQIRLPMPDGSLARFQIFESSIMQDGLARRYPEIKTYKVYGIDDMYASGRVNITPLGFSGMLHTSQGRVFIDPDYATGLNNQYLSRLRTPGLYGQGFSCGVGAHPMEPGMAQTGTAKVAHRIQGKLLRYDLAVAATEEYVTALGGTVALAQAGIVIAIDRVNQIYERDLGITFTLVAANDQLIEVGGNAGFTDGDATAMLTEGQLWIDARIGAAGYDIGHVFGTDGGGLAFLGAVCDNADKAKGVTALTPPLGDVFYIDFVAHEIGHQFNANHSFNGTTNSCGNGRNSSTTFEPGSGSTIMAYANLCGVENLQSSSDDTFHAGSIAQINSFTAGAGSCFVQVDTIPANNNDPTIAAIGNKVIPAETPFILDGFEGNPDDADMDPLMYQWDQMDAGCATDSVTFGTDNGSNALFRSYRPRDDSRRDFPALGTQIQGLYDDAEVLPCHDRELDFRLTVRDGNSGQVTENVRVSVRKSAGPFEITNLATPQVINTPVAITVNWNVANTDLPPVNCAEVDIDLLTFSDIAPAPPATYAIHPLAANVPNIGTANVFVTPAEKSHPRARVRIKCSDNIFYDVSDADLDIIGTNPTPIFFGDATFETFFNNNGTTGSVAPACGAVVDCTPVVQSSHDSGAIDYLWLLVLSGLVATIRLYQRYGLQ